MAGMTLCEPSEFYNLLNQTTTHGYSLLSDPNYMLLLDARKNHQYGESHIITAKRAPRSEGGDFLVPYDAELECKTHVIVIDDRTKNINEDSSAIACAKVMWDMGSKNTVRVLQGGYEEFSALYPFLRTQKIIYMPRELDQLQTYPVEIIPALLYLGTYPQSCDKQIQKDLKIKAHVNASSNPDTFFPDQTSSQLFRILVQDEVESDLLSHLEAACKFIESFLEAKKPVLIFSDLGISRSVTIAIAYLIYSKKTSVEDAYSHVQKCKSNIRPNRGFVKQLSQWEGQILGETATLTNVEDPYY